MPSDSVVTQAQMMVSKECYKLQVKLHKIIMAIRADFSQSAWTDRPQKLPSLYEMLQCQQQSQWEYWLMGMFCVCNSRERKKTNWAKLCLQSIEMKTPATLPRREKKKSYWRQKRNPSGKISMCGRHSTAVQREHSPNVWEQRPSFV